MTDAQVKQAVDMYGEGVTFQVTPEIVEEKTYWFDCTCGCGGYETSVDT